MEEAAQLHYERSQHLCDLSRWQEAIIEANKCLSIEPQHYRALCTISRCHFQLGDNKKTLQYAQKAIEADPTQEWAYRLQSCVYSEKNKTGKYFKHALEAVKKEPESILALQTLAYAQLKKRKYKDAAKTAEKIREIAPDSIDSHKTFGYVEFSKGNLAEAEENFRRALAIESNDYNSLNSLGEILMQKYERTSSYKRKREILNEAIESFRQAIISNPTLPEAKKNLKDANFKSLFSHPMIFLPVGFSIFALLVLVFNRGKSSDSYRPDFFSLDGKSPELIFAYVTGWLCFIIALYGIAAIYAQKGLTEANRKILEITEKPNIKTKAGFLILLLLSSYPLIFFVLKLVTLDFEAFVSFKVLDWITIVIGIIGLYLNYNILAPNFFEKKQN